jgi:hypothetical protein
MTAAFRTLVLRLDPTPLGLIPERWVIEHWCTSCRQNVGTAELLAHAQAHAGRLVESGAPPSGLADSEPFRTPVPIESVHRFRRFRTPGEETLVAAGAR